MTWHPKATRALFRSARYGDAMQSALVRTTFALGLACCLALASCRTENLSGSEAAEVVSCEVVVMGMIHSGHRTSEAYGVERVREMIRAIDPDYVLAEIPPDRLDQAVREFAATGTIEEPRVVRFPEYTDALFPLTREMDFEIVPCAAWTRAMADARSARLRELQTARPEAHAEVQGAWERMERELEEAGLDDNPEGIHTEAYDAITRRGMEPYDRLFNDELGSGGWTAINAAHFALIRAAIEERCGEGGKRFLITFGAGHKYPFLDALAGMEGVVVRNPLEFLR